MGEAIKWEGSNGEWENLIIVTPRIIKDSAVYLRGLEVGLFLSMNKPGAGKNLGACAA